MYNTDTQLLYLAVFLAKPELYTTMKKVHKPNFYNPTIKKAADYIDEYYEEYSALPDKLLIQTKTSVEVPHLPEVDFAAEQWFMKEYPKFCLHKSLEQAIYESNEELENQNYDVVEQIIQQAYEVRLGFDYGIDYDEDPKARLQNILDRSGNISTGFETIDRKIGKFNAGDLIIYAGGSGCVTYDTPVTIIMRPTIVPSKVRNEYSDFMDGELEYLANFYTEKELNSVSNRGGEFIKWLHSETQPRDVHIGSLMGDTNHSEYSYLVGSPDGWVPVLDCVEKTKSEMYSVIIDGDITIEASHDHLFQKINEEWCYARDLTIGDVLIHDRGECYVTGIVSYDEETLVYDLSVDHENHRYFTDGVCSHNTGKSLFLQNHAVNYWKEGKNVLQITLELHPELVARRMDSMLLGLSTKELYYSLDNVAKSIAIEKKKSEVKGNMNIKYMPSGTTTAEIKNLVKMYMNDTGKPVDAIIIDYLDLINPSQKVSLGDTFGKDKLVSEELRNIGQEYGPVVITASQLNRDHVTAAQEGGDLNHSHIAGGISKINTADLVLGIISNAAMREKGMYEIQALKVRNGQGTGMKFPLLYNTNTMKISDDPEYVSTINNNMSVQQSNQQLENSSVSKLANELQDALNADDPNYEPVADENDDNDSMSQSSDPRLSAIQNLINKGK